MVSSGNRAEVAELVDAHASGACGATCVSSNLSFRTKVKERPLTGALFFCPYGFTSCLQHGELFNECTSLFSAPSMRCRDVNFNLQVRHEFVTNVTNC